MYPEAPEFFLVSSCWLFAAQNVWPLARLPRELHPAPPHRVGTFKQAALLLLIFFPMSLSFLVTFLCWGFFFFFHSLESKKPEDFDRLFSLRIVFCFTLPMKWKLGFSPPVWFTLIYNFGCWQNIRKKTEKYTRWLSVSPEEAKSTLNKRSEKSRADLNFLPVGISGVPGSVDGQRFRLWEEQSAVLGTTRETKCFFRFFFTIGWLWSVDK